MMDVQLSDSVEIALAVCGAVIVAAFIVAVLLYKRPVRATDLAEPRESGVHTHKIVPNDISKKEFQGNSGVGGDGPKQGVPGIVSVEDRLRDDTAV